MDPFNLSTGGGGLSGGSSDASATSHSSGAFGGWGTSNYNFGSGSINNPNWWVIGGAIALAAFILLRKKH